MLKKINIFGKKRRAPTAVPYLAVLACRRTSWRILPVPPAAAAAVKRKSCRG